MSSDEKKSDDEKAPTTSPAKNTAPHVPVRRSAISSISDLPDIKILQKAASAYWPNNPDLSELFKSIGIIDSAALAGMSHNLYLYGLETEQQKTVRIERDKLQEKLNETVKIKKQDKETIDKLQKLLNEYESKNRLNHLLTRLDQSVHEKILSDPTYAAQFADGEKSDAYVISIDIRRSTELMLKASTPKEFADFMSEVVAVLSKIMKAEFCVVDKFTGDGMLGFFPLFYSGDDFGIRALKVAYECHVEFTKIYRSNMSSFSTVLRDIGLGIGIDYGEVQLMQVGDGLTVVGRPVVYACRLSGAPAGKTYVNQSARNDIDGRYPGKVRFELRDFQIKNEGWVVVSEAFDHSIESRASERP